MSGTGDYILGVLGLVAIALSMAIAGRTTRRAALPGWTGPPALLADAVLAIGILIVISELLGPGRHPRRRAAGRRLPDRRRRRAAARADADPRRRRVARLGEGREEPDLLPAPASGLELAVGHPVALIVVAQWAGPTLLALDRGIYGGDSLWYHMPFAAHIAQTGSVTALLFTDPLYLNWFYPQVSELLHAGGHRCSSATTSSRR